MAIKRGWSDAEQEAHDRSQRDKATADGLDQSAAPAGGRVTTVYNPLGYAGGRADIVFGPDGSAVGGVGLGSGETEVNRYRSLGEAAAKRQAYNVDFSRAQADRANSLGARGNQEAGLALMNQAQMGNAPSRAAIMGNQVAGQSLESALSAGAQGRGLGAAAAQMQAQRGQGAMQLQGAGQATGMRAGEIDQARGQYAQGMTAMRGGDYANQALSQQQAEVQAQAEMGQRRLNQSAQVGYEQAGLNVRQAELDAAMRGAAAANAQAANGKARVDAGEERKEKTAKAGLSAIGTMMGSDERMKRNVSSFSDAHAKQQAYALGRAHQWEQTKTGKPVAWAHKAEGGDIVDEPGEMSGDRARTKPAGGKASGKAYGRVVPPESTEERAAMARRVEGKPEPAPEGPGYLERAGDATYNGAVALGDAVFPAEQPMAPAQAAPPSGFAGAVARMRAMSDERAKRAEKMLGQVTEERDAMLGRGPAVGGGRPPMTAKQKALMAQAEGMMGSNAAQGSAHMSRGPAVKSRDPMTDAIADGLAPHQYEYKPEFAAVEGQQPGEKNVGIMAQNAEKNPITGTIVEMGSDGMRRINMNKSTSLALAAAGHNAQKLREQQAQLDAMKKGRR